MGHSSLTFIQIPLQTNGTGSQIFVQNSPREQTFSAEAIKDHWELVIQINNAALGTVG